MNLPLNIDLQQVLIHLLNSLLLFAALYFILYKPVKNFMAKRMQYYTDLDEEAKGKLQEAEQMRSDYEDKYAAMAETIEAERSAAMKELDAVKAQRVSEAQQEADQIIEKARVKAEAERTRILSTVQDNAWNILTDAAKALLPRNSGAAFDEFLTAAEVQKDGQN